MPYIIVYSRHIYYAFKGENMCCNNFFRNRCSNPCNYNPCQGYYRPPCGSIRTIISRPIVPPIPPITPEYAVATLNNTLAETLTTVGTPVTFNYTNAIQGSTISGNSGITVNTAGTYLINYGILASSTGTATISLYINGVENTLTRLQISDTATTTSQSIVLQLNAGDTVTLNMSSGTTDIVLPGGVSNAFITVTPSI